MLVGYKNGFAIFHPDSLTGNRELPKPYLLAVSANEIPLTKGMSFGSGQNLLRLVNQMLDLSKLEAGVLPVQLEQGDVVAFLKYLLESFHSLAANMGIMLHFHADREAFVMDYDPEKLREIVTNLLSNAVKFTPEGGQVELRFAMDDLRLTSPDAIVNRRSQIVIQDNGIGIPPEKLPFIFDRFYQADDDATRHTEGAGIGLALTNRIGKTARRRDRRA